MHHSTDCEWNEKWIERWLEHNEDVNQDLFSSFFYNNFNKENGICKENVGLVDKLKNGKYSNLVTQYLDFTKWQILNKK